MIKSCCVICGKQECPGHTYSVPGRAVTDNSAVIRALEKQVEELEAEIERRKVAWDENWMLNNAASAANGKRIALLEAVAEEAESLFRMYGHQDWCLEFTDLEQFLLAAGYLKE